MNAEKAVGTAVTVITGGGPGGGVRLSFENSSFGC